MTRIGAAVFIANRLVDRQRKRKGLSGLPDRPKLGYRHSCAGIPANINYQCSGVMEQLNSQLQLPALLERQAGQLLEEFGAGRPTPGSGSAAALMGLLAAKLAQTVCTISIRKRPRQVSLYQLLREQVLAAEPRLKELFEEDSRLFAEVIERRQQRDAAQVPRQKAALSRAANDRLETATGYSLEIADLCLDLTPHAITLFRQGWPAVRGDSGAALSSAIAGATSAIFITNLNIKSLTNRRAAAGLKLRADVQLTRLQGFQQEVVDCLQAINDEAGAALREDLQLSFDLNS